MKKGLATLHPSFAFSSYWGSVCIMPTLPQLLRTSGWWTGQRYPALRSFGTPRFGRETQHNNSCGGSSVEQHVSPRLAFRRACRRNSSFCELFATPQVEGWAVMDIHWSYGRCLSCRWSAVRSALRSLRGSVPQWIRESHPKLGWWSQAAAELATWFLDRIDSLVSHK